MAIWRKSSGRASFSCQRAEDKAIWSLVLRIMPLGLASAWYRYSTIATYGVLAGSSRLIVELFSPVGWEGLAKTA